MQFSSSRAIWFPLLYVGECVIALFLGLYAVSFGVIASYAYPDNQLISWTIVSGAILYMSAIGAGSRLGVIFPLLVLGFFVFIALSQGFSFHEWVGSWAWVVYISVGLSLYAYFKHRRQAWLLPAAVLCALTALVAQVCYTPWKIRHIFDTLGLCFMLAEPVCRSITSLCLGSYFYSNLVCNKLCTRKKQHS